MVSSIVIVNNVKMSEVELRLRPMTLSRVLSRVMC